jgi:hypothetical protein
MNKEMKLPATDFSSHKEYAWKYFQLNAEQRMKAFNFSLILVGVSIGALANLLRFKNYEFAIVIGAFLFVASIIFLMIDLRSRQLLRYGIEALKSLEKQDSATPEIIDVFTQEEKYKKEHWFWGRVLSYTFAINIFYIVTMLVGLLAAYYSYCQIPANS